MLLYMTHPPRWSHVPSAWIRYILTRTATRKYNTWVAPTRSIGNAFKHGQTPIRHVQHAELPSLTNRIPPTRSEHGSHMHTPNPSKSNTAFTSPLPKWITVTGFVPRNLYLDMKLESICSGSFFNGYHFYGDSWTSRRWHSDGVSF